MTDHERNEISVFRPHRPGIRKLLGDLEADIMEVAWARLPGTAMTVREVHAALQATRESAYSTVLTVMGVLVKKKLLRVKKDSLAHHYAATTTKDAFTRNAVADILDQLLGDFAEPTLAHFAEALDFHDAEALAKLRGLIERRRLDEA